MARIQSGVYACFALVDGKRWQAVTNIGIRPTFETGPVPPRVEAHLLDFDQDLYGETIALDFITFLREEQRFSGIEELIQQVNRDILKARQVLA
jgi:riboflavin kinase/FMN adenylyltransferase